MQKEYNVKKNICNIKELNGLLQNNSCVVYGAGYKAQVVTQYCVNYFSKNVIDRIVVTTKDNNPEEILGIPVKEISSYSIKEDSILLVCTASDFWNEIEECLNKYVQCENIYYLKENIYEKLRILNYDDDTENALEQNAYMQNLKFDELQYKFSRLVPRPNINYMVLNILNHCNLRCQGCDHFACIADEYLVSYETISHDIEKLSQIMGGDLINKIAVMGGEPLLHPELLSILKVVRKYFPYAEIRLTTNGILLLQQTEEFWKVCRENDIHIVNTKYPINLNYDAIIAKAKEENVVFYFYEGTGGKTIKKSFKKHINLAGNSDVVKSFLNCNIRDIVAFVNEGKMYSCPFSCMSNIIFNQKFNQNLRLTEGDYLTLDNVNDKEEIFNFLARPKYYCRYCQGVSEPFDWARTKGEISEWV